MPIDKNINPYYNDYDETKKYYEIMFRPSIAVQARELSQLQTMLQKQIERFGKHIFKDGAQVLGGEIALDNNYAYVKLESVPTNFNNFVTKRITGLTSGAIADVLEIAPATNTEPATLYIKYLSGDSTKTATGNTTNGSQTISGLNIDANVNLIVGSKISGSGIPANSYIVEIVSSSSIKISNPATATNSGTTLTISTQKQFVDNEILKSVESNLAITPLTANTKTIDSIGTGSKVTLQQGIYFVQGYFCFVESQSIIINKYFNLPSNRVGFKIVDSFVTADDDVSLTDPAQGSKNYGNSGANRYSIHLELTKYDLVEDVPNNFIELIRVSQGVIQKQVTKTEYSEIEKTLARRTYDESGDYTVRHFPLDIREHLDTGDNRGIYSTLQGGVASKLAIGIEQGKAYVRGYEIETVATKFYDVDKARDTKLENNIPTIFTLGNFIGVNNLSGGFDFTNFETVNLYSVIKSNGAWGSSIIGTAKVRALEYISGTVGTTGALYALYIYDINMTNPNMFSAIRSIGLSQSNSCDVFLVEGLAQLVDTNLNNLFLQLPYNVVKSVTDFTYKVKRVFNGTMAGNSLVISAGTNEVFDPATVISYHVSIVTASATAISNGFVNGSVIDMQSGGNSIVLGGSPVGKQATLNIPAINGSTIRVLATITKTTGVQKTKTLVQNIETLPHINTIQLNKADIYRIVSIVDSVTSQNITNKYVLDNGQRDSYYDRGKLSFITGNIVPTGNVVITYEYFNHGVGDFFSVDSYNGVVDYDDIPDFISPNSTQAVSLRDVIDFRPRVNDSGTGYSILSEFPVVDSAYVTDIEYYIPRIDKIVLNEKGEFSVIKGVSSVNPAAPKTPDNAMCIYELTFNPYTFNTKDVLIKLIDNKRYTMRDIGKLEKRIDNLEYYTTLSLLEKETADLFIDDGTGKNRFKNGFLVDNFSSTSVGDTFNTEFKCSIDRQNRILRTQFRQDNVRMSLETSLSTDYQKTGDLLTLPYTTEAFITQKFASKTENINPYAIFSWTGSIKLEPSIDDWMDTTRLPDRIIENDVASGLEGLNGSIIWNDWQDSWTGTPFATISSSNPTLDLLRSVNPNAHNGDRGGIKWGSARQINPLIWSGRIQTRGLRILATEERVVARQVGQTRTGTRISVVPEVTTENLGDRVLNISSIPFMRSRLVEFTANNLKPNTRVYPFFDGVSVSIYTKPTGGNNNDPLITDSSGRVSGVFEIPNTDTLRFRTGKRVFSLSDDIDNNKNFISTNASEIYEASGTSQTVQGTIVSTRTSKIATEVVNDGRVINRIDRETRTFDIGYYDPLAQTFLVESEGGIFVPKIDIFFATKDTKGLPVTLQIRTTNNGYPAQNILPFSEKTLTPDQVNVSIDGSAVTSFVFDSPVYLQQGQEYCFVLLSNSVEYLVWCSKIGEFDISNGERITSQPYAGVMFKSQNASTWTADQEQDIKFTIHKCNFDTNVVSDIRFRNEYLEDITLPSDPLYFTNGSNIVKIKHENHGLITGQNVVISGILGTINGIPASELNGTKPITVVDIDHYNINTTTNANLTGLAGSDVVKVSNSIKADVLNLMSQNTVLTGTNIDWGVKGKKSSGAYDTNFLSLTPNSNLELDESYYVHSDINDTTNNKSLEVLANLYSDNENVSPVIDLQRLSFIAVANRLNNDSTNETTNTGNAQAKYVTKKIELANPATGIRVYLSGVRAPSSEIKVYAKILPDSLVDSSTFDSREYVELDKVQYPIGDIINFKDYIFEKDNLENFSIYSIKVVMLGDNTATPPMVSDFRTLALL